MEKSLVYLKDSNGALVPAELFDEIADEHVKLWEAQWKPAFHEKRQRLIHDGVPKDHWPQDMLWDWRKNATLTRKYLAYRCFTIVCGGRLQGLMLVDLASFRARTNSQIGKDIVYVHLLSTAPWNRPAFSIKPNFTGVGTNMIRVAVDLSLQEGFHGRIGLHSLPDAEVFYREKCSMTDLGPDNTHHGLTYFEMTEAQASEFIT